jgi:release factor glutamine methyltransferase
MDTIGEAADAYKKALAGIYEPNEIEALTLLTLSAMTGATKAQLKAFPEKTLMAGQADSLQNILTRLQTGEPIQYILGHTEFHGLPFNVNPSVLIPRPETEELVEWILDTEDNLPFIIDNILDIGTGSGCIAISLKKELPGVAVTAIDISPTALQTAQENAALNHVQVNFIQADILNPTTEIENLQFDIIVSNPPYVTLQDKTQMHRNVTDFEPHSALFVPENDPLVFYKAIADFALKTLRSEGVLFFEINENLGNETMEMLKSKGFKNIEMRKDMSGRDRIIRTKI